MLLLLLVVVNVPVQCTAAITHTNSHRNCITPHFLAAILCFCTVLKRSSPSQSIIRVRASEWVSGAAKEIFRLRIGRGRRDKKLSRKKALKGKANTHTQQQKRCTQEHLEKECIRIQCKWCAVAAKSKKMLLLLLLTLALLILLLRHTPMWSPLLSSQDSDSEGGNEIIRRRWW